MIYDIKKKTVVGNWKMHTTYSDARDLAQGIVDGLIDEERISVILCPHFPYLALIGDIIQGSRIALGLKTCIPKRKAPSPARSARRCSSISDVGTSSWDTASAATSWANPTRSSTKK